MHGGWIFKSEPHVFSFEHLREMAGQEAIWDGVRNYQARNFLRGTCKLGEPVLFYHSSCPVPGIAGLAEITKEGFPDPTAEHEDPPRWFAVSVGKPRRLGRFVPLTELRAAPGLGDLALLQRGTRLSVLPITRAHFQLILQLAGETRL